MILYFDFGWMIHMIRFQTFVKASTTKLANCSPLSQSKDLRKTVAPKKHVSFLENVPICPILQPWMVFRKKVFHGERVWEKILYQSVDFPASFCFHQFELKHAPPRLTEISSLQIGLPNCNKTFPSTFRRQTVYFMDIFSLLDLRYCHI